MYFTNRSPADNELCAGCGDPKHLKQRSGASCDPRTMYALQLSFHLNKNCIKIAMISILLKLLFCSTKHFIAMRCYA